MTDRVADPTGRSALTLVLPFGVYLAADELQASGVVAVVVVALQLRSYSNVDEAQERLVQRSFWDVVELLVTGIGFGLIGLNLRTVTEAAGDELGVMLVHAAVVVAVVLAVRAAWMAAAVRLVQRSSDTSAAPRNGREAVVLSWCGMRGLATLALALSLPPTTQSAAEFPARVEIVLIAVAVLAATLVVPGFTLPALVRVLGVRTDVDTERAAEEAVAQRAQKAALDRLAEAERENDLSEDVSAALHDRMRELDILLCTDPDTDRDRERLDSLRRGRAVAQRVQSLALEAARAEVLAARREPGVDPEAADRVLHRLDLRTVLLD